LQRAEPRAFPSLAEIQQERQRRSIEREAGSWAQERQRCKSDIGYFFDRWLFTYDPRLKNSPTGPFVPFKLWPKQREFLYWVKERSKANEEGLCEKSRDVGVTYLCGGAALHDWLFAPGSKWTFGSRVEDLVDQKNNADSIFAKIRIMLYRLPKELMPEGFSPAQHDNYMRLYNPETGALISGEGGTNMGRGGRSSVYVADEAAFIEHAETVEKALSGNTDCILWVSSVNGMGNLFARKRHSILKPHQIFRLHWRDDPRKSEEWAQTKKDSFSDPTGWASEYDIDYSASVEGICIPAAWVESAKRIATLEPTLAPSNAAKLGGDVGAGKAKSITITRRGAVIERPQSRKDPDTTETAHWMLGIARATGAAELHFDAVGVGAGVSSTLMHNPVEGVTAIPVNTGVPPSETRVWPDKRKSIEIFGNLKAELWWLCRTALQRTHEHVLFLEGKEGGKRHDLTDLLSLPSGDRDSDQLCLEISLVKWGKNEKGKIVIEKKEALAKRGIKSPDYADALMLTFNDAPIANVAMFLTTRQ
jgi:phage terminase large subunit